MSKRKVVGASLLTLFSLWFVWFLSGVGARKCVLWGTKEYNSPKVVEKYYQPRSWGSEEKWTYIFEGGGKAVYYTGKFPIGSPITATAKECDKEEYGWVLGDWLHNLFYGESAKGDKQ